MLFEQLMHLHTNVHVKIKIYAIYVSIQGMYIQKTKEKMKILFGFLKKNFFFISYTYTTFKFFVIYYFILK